jgi:hypothetical protein
MSLVKAVLDDLKDCKCKITGLHECPPISNVPDKYPYSRDGLCHQGKPFQDIDWQRYGATSSYLALQYVQGTPHRCRICPKSNQKKGILNANVESSKVYMVGCGRIKQANAQLAELGGDNHLQDDH